MCCISLDVLKDRVRDCWPSGLPAKAQNEFRGAGAICGGDKAKAFDKRSICSILRIVLIALVALAGLVIIGCGIFSLVGMMGLVAPGMMGLVGACCVGAMVAGMLLLIWSVNYGVKVKKATELVSVNADEVEVVPDVRTTTRSDSIASN
ncbi:MAG: hypothetical protein RRZ67_04500 [Victivallaceae bacterium]